ncbi:hypothetical protein GIB67_024997 [Kingdonia uniflora]|uniref:LysM domain-containing protein n=1 Tax=Kingdonia uniflora TaxID=39325 RepID=A0A7J7N7S0_9MAGN|nr:hypothetical protein GIB67_024997 [Kingdonia uniflora]
MIHAEPKEFSFHERAVGSGAVSKGPKCKSVFGVRAGDTCFAITQLVNITTNFFLSINPNLVCNELFVGQWLCVAGTA